MPDRNARPEEEWMSTATLTHYIINAAITGLALGAVAALVALFVAK